MSGAHTLQPGETANFVYYLGEAIHTNCSLDAAVEFFACLVIVTGSHPVSLAVLDLDM